jgi:RHS repeat-associated protein
VEVSEKRYRYTGKERDEETGFQYHSARYLAPWLGRWTSADAAGLVDAANRFGYASCNPAIFADPSGRQKTSVLLGSPLSYVVATPAPQSGGLAAGIAARAAWSGKTTTESLQDAINKEVGPGYYLPDPELKKAAALSSPLTNKQRAALHAGAQAVLASAPGLTASIHQETESDAEGAREFMRGIAECENDAHACSRDAPDAYAFWLRRRREESDAALGRRASEAGVSPRDQAAAETAIQFGELALWAIDLGAIQPASGASKPAVEFQLRRTRDYVPDLASRTTGRTAQVRNAIIEDIASKELRGVKFTAKAEFSPFLEEMGVSQEGVGSQVGSLPFNSANPRTEVAGTMIHEELHQRWWARGMSDHHGPELNHRFEKTIDRFGKRKGWPEGTGQGKARNAATQN